MMVSTVVSRRRGRAVTRWLLCSLVAMMCVQTAGVAAGTCAEGASCGAASAEETRVCSSRTLAAGACLSLATAGARASFTVMARDAAGAQVLDSRSGFRVDLVRGGLPAPAEAASFSQPCLSTVGKCVSAVRVLSGGADCTVGGTLGTSGGGGAGFLATFTVDGSGAVETVTLLDGGSGYTSLPTVTIASGGYFNDGWTLPCSGTSFAVDLGSGGDHTVSYRVTASGTYSLQTSLVRQGGLAASYFANARLLGASPAYAGVDRVIDFDWGPGPIAEGVSSGGRASARWEGLVRALETAETSFHVRSDGGARLWVNNVQVLDTWNASSQGGGMWAGARNISMAAGALYSIRLEYTHERPGPASASLLWGSVFRPTALVPATQLFWKDGLGGSPIALTVRAGIASASLSRLIGVPRSVEAGEVVFGVDVRDVFNNSRGGEGGDAVTATLALASLGAAVSWEDAGAGPLRGRAAVERVGTWAISASLFASPIGGSPAFFEVVPGPFDAASSELVGNGAGGLGFAATRGSPATFVIRARDRYGNAITDDASLRFTAAVRLDGVIQVLCPVAAAGAGSYNASCSYQYPGKYELDVRGLGDAKIAPSPVQLLVLPGGTCASRCALSGASLTVATSGGQAQFTIRARDSLGAPKMMGGDQFALSMRGGGAQSIAGSVADPYAARDGAATAGGCAEASSDASPAYVAGPLTSSMTSISTTLSFASGSPQGVAVGSFLRVEGEAMSVASVLSTVSYGVTRAVSGTLAASHAAGAFVYVSAPQCAPGTYVATYTLTRSGTYTLGVTLGGLFGVPPPQAGLTVLPGVVCASSCYPRGAGLTIATAGQRTAYTVFARDQYGNDVFSLGGRRLSFSVFDGTVGVVADGVVEPSSEVGQDAGTFQVVYTPTRGHYAPLLHDIEMDGTPISGSLAASTRVLVVPPPLLPARCTLSAVTSLTAGVPATFTVTAFDRFGASRSPNSIVALRISGVPSTAAADSTAVPLEVACVAPCTGSGLTATYAASGTVITSVTITDPGHGYDPLSPPVISDAANAPRAVFAPEFGSGGYQLFSAYLRGSQGPGGLASTYYASPEFTSPRRSRGPEGPVDFSGSCGPGGGVLPSGLAPCLGATGSLPSGDGFAVRWTGFVSPSRGGEYTFKAAVLGTDERVRLWVDHSLLIDAWTSLSSAAPSATYGVAHADALYSVTVEYMEADGTEGLAMFWETASLPQQVIPSSRLFAASHTVHLRPTDAGGGSLSVPVTVTRSGTYSAHVSLATRGGLRGVYYRNGDLQDTGGELVRTDPVVDFDWGSRGPLACFPVDDFSARWTGFVRPPYSEIYTVGIRVDDTASVWLDDALVVDSASSDSDEWVVFTTYLEQGAMYPIKIEYREHQVRLRFDAWCSGASVEVSRAECETHHVCLFAGDPHLR